jgi:ClpP class serine protease
MRKRAQPEMVTRYVGGALLKVLHETSGDFIFRQRLIHRIERERKRRLVTYVSNVEHPAVQIDLNDAHNLETCFRAPSEFKPIDLLIHSPGGQADAAERIINMARSYSGNDFRVVVPSYAKSAATIIGLGADTIVMSDGSELGPIDPQFILTTPQGSTRRAAASFVEHRNELLEKIRDGVQKQEPIQGYMQMLSQVDGPFVKECERAMNLSKEMAKKWLKAHMMRGKNDSEIQKAVDEFSDPTRTLSHGRMIDYKQAKSVGIEIEYIPKESELWEVILELLFRSTNFLNMEASRIKLYECATVSLKSEAVLRAVPVRQ